MFKPLSMQHVSLWVLNSDAPQASLLLATYGIFTPEKSQAWERDLPETPGDRYAEVFAEAKARLNKILEHYGPTPLAGKEIEFEDAAALPAGPDAPTLDELQEWNAWLGELWNVASRCEEEKRRINEALEHNASLLSSLEHFRKLDIDLAWLARPKRFLQTRIGIVPVANLARLSEALELSGFVLEVFDTQDGRAYAVAAGPVGRAGEIRGAMDAAGWQEMTLEPELLAHPEKAREALLKASENLRAEAETSESRHRATLGDVDAKLRDIRKGLALAEPYVRISAETLRARGGLALITGWIPQREVERLRQALDTRLKDRYVLQLRPPFKSELDAVPSAVRYPDWLGPFADLVRNYGIPRYGEFDPTWLFAISFVLMFGMMFGDIGQGLVIAAVGLFLRGKAKRFRSLFIGAGLSATAFGFAYGSLFGFETVVEPLWVSPLHDPERMLLAAVWWGVGFITVTQLLTIYNRLASGMVARALFDAAGVAGLLLYLGAAAGVYGLATDGEFGVTAALLAGAGLAAILAWNWAENRGGAAERLLTVIIETFESVIGFFSNTLSFMRVAAFSINHVALALAVFTIADSLGTTGRWITLVIGNLVILGLEGAIVAIQVLRLEYYEGFSRFYSGSGRAFQPLVLHRQRHLKT
ncbi:MAG: V-type ATPase 116kDa subunit family protein [Pseudomonadota bacterium]